MVEKWKRMKRDGIGERASPRFVAAMDSVAKKGSRPEITVDDPHFSVETPGSKFASIASDLETLEKQVLAKAFELRMAELNEIDRQLDLQLRALRSKRSQ